MAKDKPETAVKATAPPMPMPKGWLAIAILSLAAVLPYLNSFQNSFHFDDDGQIKNNEELAQPGRVVPPGPLFRKLTFGTFLLNYRLHGLDYMPGWHAVNIAAHLACVLLLYAVVRHLMKHRPAQPRAAVPPDRPSPVPFLAALLFAVHPLATEPVNYIQARAVLFYTCFTLVALLGAIWIHRKAALGGKIAGGLILLLGVAGAALSKEVGIFFALAAVGLYWLLFVLPGSPNRKRQLSFMAAAVVGGVGLGLVWVIAGNAYESISQRINSLFWPHLAMQTVIFWKYIYLAFVPLPTELNVDHYVAGFPPRPGMNWWSDSYAHGILGLAALILLAAVFMWPRWRRPAVTFMLLMLPVGLAPYFFMASEELMVEYRFYLPLAAFCVLASMALTRLFLPFPKTGLAVIVLLCLGMGYCTWQRNYDWRTNIGLWEDALHKSPRKARTLNGLAWALVTAKEGQGRDVERGLQLAQQSLPRPDDFSRVDPWSSNPMMADTLAEAFYANGRFQDAVNLETKLADAYPQEKLFRRQLAKFQAALDQAIASSQPVSRPDSR